MPTGFRTASKLFVISEKPDETELWLPRLESLLHVVRSASALGAWQLLQGDRVCAVVVQLIAPRSHALQVVSILRARSELRGTPIYVVMPDPQPSHPKLAALGGVILLPEATAATTLPEAILRHARGGSGVRPTMTTHRLANMLHASEKGRPAGDLQKASRTSHKSTGRVITESDVEPTTKLATSSGERW